MGKGIYIDKARQGSEGSDNPLPIDLQHPQQLQVSADGLARSFLSSFIGSGNSLYSSTSVSWKQTRWLKESLFLLLPALAEKNADWVKVRTGISWRLEAVTCLRALRAMVWKACSTLIASLALVSKYGMLFLLWHQACARLVVTWNTKELTLYSEMTGTGQRWIKAIWRIVPLLWRLKEMVHVPYVTIQTHLSVLQVDLVAQHHKREILWVSRTSLDQEFVPPAV